MIATLIEGNTDAADICLLIAVILFTIATIIALTNDTPLGALIPAGLTTTALGLLVL